jgi:hypothetical protein
MQAGEEGLEPPANGFGIRRSTIGATRLLTHTIEGRIGELSQNPNKPIRIDMSPYSTISDTTPAPTVRPPSRIAKRTSLSIAIGLCKVTSN